MMIGAVALLAHGVAVEAVAQTRPGAAPLPPPPAPPVAAPPAATPPTVSPPSTAPSPAAPSPAVQTAPGPGVRPASAPPLPPPDPRQRREPPAFPIAELRTLDKITGRVRAVEVAVGEPTPIGTLIVTVQACRKRPPEEPPESGAFLVVDEQRPGEAAPHRLFAGWMFSSSPAVSALEHAVYDVWISDCRAAATASSSSR